MLWKKSSKLAYFECRLYVVKGLWNCSMLEPLQFSTAVSNELTCQRQFTYLWLFERQVPFSFQRFGSHHYVNLIAIFATFNEVKLLSRSYYPLKSSSQFVTIAKCLPTLFPYPLRLKSAACIECLSGGFYHYLHFSIIRRIWELNQKVTILICFFKFICCYEPDLFSFFGYWIFCLKLWQKYLHDPASSISNYCRETDGIYIEYQNTHLP